MQCQQLYFQSGSFQNKLTNLLVQMSPCVWELIASLDPLMMFPSSFGIFWGFLSSFVKRIFPCFKAFQI